MAPVKTYTATATREGRYWVIDVKGVGVTQARNLREAHVMAADLISAVRDIPATQVNVSIAADLEPEIARQVAETKKALAAFDKAQRDIARQQRSVVARLRGAGLTGADTAAVLGVSPQRVSQLAPKRAAARTKRATKA
jgi:DNA-directed RNA polymerase specialized sigma24 family protein